MKQVVTNFGKGAVVGSAMFTPLHFLLKKRSATYRSLPLPGKVFLGMMSIVPVATVFAEKAGEHYISDNMWDSVGKTEIERQAHESEERWNKLSTTEKAKDWAGRNQYSIIGGSWVASLGIAFGIVQRNKHQTFSQKLVQARMWAQGLTVGVLLVSAVLAGVNAKGEKPKRAADHSWKDILEQGGSLTQPEKIHVLSPMEVKSSL